jgi:hypothetical protein
MTLELAKAQVSAASSVPPPSNFGLALAPGSSRNGAPVVYDVRWSVDDKMSSYAQAPCVRLLPSSTA